LVAWIAGLGVVLFQAGNAAAQGSPLPACTASSGSCAGQLVGSFCDSGDGSNVGCTGAGTPLLCCTGAGTGNCDQSNCTITGFVSVDGIQTPNCSCPNLDCSVPGSCFETKYGLGDPADWQFLPHGFRDEFAAQGLPVPGVPNPNPTHDDFIGSYTYSRGSSTSTGILSCNLGENSFVLQMGTWIFRERAGCDPFDTVTNPVGCPLKLGLDANLDRPTHPEHVFTERRHLADFNVCGGPPTFPRCEFFARIASTGTGFGVGHRIPNARAAENAKCTAAGLPHACCTGTGTGSCGTEDADCTGLDTPHACCTGAGTGSCGSDTRVNFDVTQGTPGGVRSRICCNTQSGDARDICTVLLGAAGGVDKYPLIGGIPNTSDNYVNFNGLIFDADPAFPPYGRWKVDQDVIVPGSRYGVCKNTRTRPCDCGPTGSGTLTGGCTVNGDESDPCPTLATGPEICDLREMGWRLNPADRNLTPGPGYGTATPGICNKGPFVFQGTPQQNCLIGTIYQENRDCTDAGAPYACCTGAGTGTCRDPDPGPDCGTLNFGAHQRPDLDCNGVVDTLNANAGADDDENDDYCPHYTETNLTADADGNGRGDECECGDADANGAVNVSDIIAANISIFNPPSFPTLWFHQPPYATCGSNPEACFRRILTPLMDANNDQPDGTSSDGGLNFDKWATGGFVNVSDLVQINLEIFNPKTARCGRSPVVGE
jgi:hypothetical protein